MANFAIFLSESFWKIMVCNLLQLFFSYIQPYVHMPFLFHFHVRTKMLCPVAVSAPRSTNMVLIVRGMERGLATKKKKQKFWSPAALALMYI